MAVSSLPPGPFTHVLGFDAAERAQVRSRLDGLGVRAMPYPFSSAMAVVSDCDGSSLTRYEAYAGAFNRLGLDFGDSSWLRWVRQTSRDGAVGLGFWSYAYSKGKRQRVEALAATRTFAHSIAEFHAGNVDHFHSLLRDGPRVAIIDCDAADGERVEIAAGPFAKGGRGRTDDLHLFGILVEGVCRGAGVVEEDGTETTAFRRLAAPREGQTLFALALDPEGEDRPPPLGAVRAVRLSGARGVRRVILLSAHSGLLIDRVAALRTYNVEIGLITEHARLHFRYPAGAAVDDKAASERLAGHQGPAEGLYGAISGPDGLIVSTDADDPASVCRVLPEMFDLGLRFLTPMAVNSHTGLDLLEVVSPTPTRAGGGGYWARRTVPLGRLIAHSRQDSFTTRMRKALDDAETAPGQVWPIYTHLGAMTSDAGRSGPPVIPDPYFDEDAMRALQDAALGVRGERARMWFTRATTLYDYCLIVRSIGDHVRRDGDAIDIASWLDGPLGRMLPVSPAQLYGLTFYVDDAATAVVRLDGRVIDTVSRNGPDDTGRRSVTVLEAEIRGILFDRLSPLANDPDEAEIVGDCAWRDGQLVVDGAVTLPLHGFNLPSAQALAFTAKGTFGVRLRTQGGGSFYFGDPRWGEASDDASYAFPGRDSGRFVVPFYDLEWRASTGAHLPSHPLASITFMGKASFAAPTFLRPRATTLSRETFCVTGQVPRFEPGQVVNLNDRQDVVDQRGWFCFPETPAGVYRLTTDGRCDRRGPLVEIGADVVNLELSRAL